MSETNNTDVSSGAETVVKTGSSSEPVSFDEMESIMESKPAKPASKPEPKEKSAKEKPQSDSKKRKSDEEGDDDSDSDETEDEEQTEKSDKSKDQKKPDDKDAPKVKSYKVKSGDQDVEVRADTKFQVKINGKAEDVDLQSLLNEYSGKTDWTRKYQALDTERKSFETERNDLQSAIDTLHDLAVTKQKPTEAVAFLADLLGGDGIKVVEQMQAQMFKAFEEMSKLTPEERRARQAEERAATLEAREQSRRDDRAKADEQAAVAKRVDAVKTKHNITDERFKDIYNSLKSHIKPDELTPELIGDVHQRWLQMDEVDAAVEELKPEGDLVKIKTALLDEWKKDPSLTAQDIRTLLTEVFGGKKPGSKLKQKIEKSGGTTVNKTTARSEHKEALTFDDL